MYLAFLITIQLLVSCNDAVRINFTSCQSPEWACSNRLPTDIVYTCSLVPSNDFVIHLKDYYTNHITSVTVQNCRDIRVILDCTLLQKSSKLQRFTIKESGRVEFIGSSSNSLLQTPAEVIIENVREIVSLPRNMFKSPASYTELKCLGTNNLRKVRIVNSNIISIKRQAIYNVTGIKNIEFENVTVFNMDSQAIEAIMGNDNTIFSIANSKMYNISYKGIVVKSKKVVISNNEFSNIYANTMNLTTDNLQLTGNKIRDIYSNAFLFKSVITNITNNNFDVIRTNGFAGIKCARKRTSRYFNFCNNKIQSIEPNGLVFDYNSCKSAGTAITIAHNKVDCKCRNVSYLTLSTTNTELNNLILDLNNNNTCISAPCYLPIDVVKLLLDSDMCQLNLDPQVMCLLYNDKQNSNTNEVTTDEEVTEPVPSFYLIRQANLPNGDASAAMTAIDKDDLLKGSNFNMTNRTAIKVVFDSSRDFVETLRSTGTRRRPNEETKTPAKEEHANRCVGTQCRNNVAYDKQKALDFYRYVYAQLRPPRHNENEKT